MRVLHNVGVLCLVAWLPLELAGNLIASPATNVVLINIDDMGWADIGANGVPGTGVMTPNIDALAASGVRFSNGYVTASLCAPSRAGLLTGRYQQKFGFETNIHGPLPLTETTVAERIRDQGYTTGLVGKWHLEPRSANTEWVNANLGGDWSTHTQADIAPYRSFNRGFTETFEGDNNTVWATYDLDGNTLPGPTFMEYPGQHRVDLKTQAGLQFIDRHAGDSQPFFLYLSYFAPHTPLNAPQEYLDRFPGEMPERRRHALALISAIDDGVGAVVNKLAEQGLTDDTLVMVVSDNGAQLAFDMQDTMPLSRYGWNGSLNTPFVGEKSALTEGGIRVPYLASWPGTLPAGTVYDHPVLQIDASATAVALAGGDISGLDGKNLLPHLTGQTTEAPHDVLYWRSRFQGAVREGNWKLLRMPDNQRWLFDLSDPQPERVNLAGKHPALVERLTQLLDTWSADLPRPLENVAPPNMQVIHNHALPLPLTGVDPKVSIDLGYDPITASNELHFDQGDLMGAAFSGIRLGGGVTSDLRGGTSTANGSAGGGAQSFHGWDLPPASGGGALQDAIASDHYIEFDLMLDGNEVVSLDGIQMSGITTDHSANWFALLASDDGFAGGASLDDLVDRKTFGHAFGDVDDAGYPVRNYRFVDYIPDEPLVVDEDGSVWTFRLYINEDGTDDLNALMIDTIAFDYTELSEGDINRDGSVDYDDLAYFNQNYGSLGGRDFLEWQRTFSESGASLSASIVPEPSGAILALVVIALACAQRRG